MIISCINCNKKFEINSDLIPENGRLLECSSCNHQWFYKKEKELVLEKQVIESTVSDIKIIKKSINNAKNIKTTKKPIKIDIDNYNEKKVFIKKKISFLSFILIFIISCVALITLIDTFKGPLSLFVPNIELILYNLYETIKDIILFSKDLI